MDDSPEANAPSILLPYTKKHDEATVRWLNDSHVKSTFGLQRSVSLDTHRRWVESATDTRIWAITDASCRHVGNVLLKINEQHATGYFQIYIGEARARGTGLGSQALQETLQKAFQKLALHRVWLHSLPSNLQARKLYAKFGFVMEGIEREALLVDNHRVDQERWSLLAHEWKERLRKLSKI